MTCKRGHEFRGDENYRASTGRCPVCFRETQARWDRTIRGRERHVVYNHSDKGGERTERYVQSPKGWLNALNDRHAKALRRRAIRNQTREAEDSSGQISP